MFENIVVVALEVSVVIVGSGIVLFDTDVLVVLKYPEKDVEVAFMDIDVVVLKNMEVIVGPETVVLLVGIEVVMLELSVVVALRTPDAVVLKYPEVDVGPAVVLLGPCVTVILSNVEVVVAVEFIIIDVVEFKEPEVVVGSGVVVLRDVEVVEFENPVFVVDVFVGVAILTAACDPDCSTS